MLVKERLRAFDGDSEVSIKWENDDRLLYRGKVSLIFDFVKREPGTKYADILNKVVVETYFDENSNEINITVKDNLDEDEIVLFHISHSYLGDEVGYVEGYVPLTLRQAKLVAKVLDEENWLDKIEEGHYDTGTVIDLKDYKKLTEEQKKNLKIFEN